MRRISLIILICCLLLGCSTYDEQAVATQITQTSNPVPQSTTVACALEAPLEFANEEALAKSITEETEMMASYSKTNSANSNNSSAPQGAESTYNLEVLHEIYRPVHVPLELTLYAISVKKEYVSYDYSDSDGNPISFTWYRLFPADPEFSMYSALNRGENSHELVEINGIEYLILEFDAGYEVNWIKDGLVFGVSSITNLTKEQVLAFCEYEVVPVR